MKYEVAVKRTIEQLEQEVNKMINLGWEPLGGISSAPTGVAQAMIDRELPTIEEIKEGMRSATFTSKPGDLVDPEPEAPAAPRAPQKGFRDVGIKDRGMV